MSRPKRRCQPPVRYRDSTLKEVARGSVARSAEAESGAVKVGDIGFTFTKPFDGVFYVGKVVRIRHGAGKHSII